MTKKQKRSSRKNMANRSTLKYFKRMETAHLASTMTASAVKPKSTGGTGYAASLKRASGRGA
jgi:hypothetical protein